MKILLIVVAVVAVLIAIALALVVRVIHQYEQGVLFRLGGLRGSRAPALRLIIPFADVLHRVSLRLETMPIRSQGIIARHNDSADTVRPTAGLRP